MSDVRPTGDDLQNLLAHGARGEESACAALYHAFSPGILRLAVGLLNDLEDAEEVTQDTFVYAFRNLARYDSTKSAFNTWLFTIALSRCRNKRRRKWLESLPLSWLEDKAPAEPGRAIEMLLVRKGIRRQVWAALQTQPTHLREAIALRYLAGMRYKEIGETLQCHPKTVESRVRLGLANMRQLLHAQGLELEAEAEWAL